MHELLIRNKEVIWCFYFYKHHIISNMLITIVLSISGALFAATFFKTKFGDSFVITLGAIISFLYLFYIFDILYIGFLVAIGLCICCYLATIIALLTKKIELSSFCNCFFSPGFFTMLILFVVYRVFVRNSVPILWDELRLWAAVPKALFMTDKLQVGKGAYIFPNMQSYFPGLALLQYFFQKANLVYKEWLTFYVYAILGASFFLPAVENVKKKKSLVLFMAMIVFFLPMTFYNSEVIANFAVYYKNLYIDGLLGLAFGYCIYSVWRASKNCSLLNFVHLCTSVALLMLLKESGLLLAILCICLLVVTTKKKRITLVPLGLVLFIKVSWSYVLRANSIQTTGSWINSNNIINLFVTPSDAQVNEIKDGFKSLIGTCLIDTNWQVLNSQPWMLSWCALFAAYLGIVAWIYIKSKDDKVTKFLIGAGVLDIIYTMSLLFMLVAKPGMSLSYQRYVSTGLTALLAVLFMISLHLWAEDKLRFSKVEIVYIMITAVLFFPLRDVWLDEVLDMRMESENYVNQMNRTIRSVIGDDSTVNLYLAMGNRDTLYHHQIYNQLMDKNIIVRNVDDFSIDMTPLEGLYNAIAIEPTEKCDWLFITDRMDIDKFRNSYGSCFDGNASAIETNSLYKIIYDNQKVQFILAGHF